MPISIPSPGDFIREELKKRSWSQEDLAQILGRTATRISQLLKGKQEVSPEIAVELETAFGIPAAVWMQREAEYRLSQVRCDTGAIRQRTKIFAMAPVKEMQKRGWVRNTDDMSALEEDVSHFFEIKNVNEQPELLAAMRKSAPMVALTGQQLAWCYRVRQLSKSVMVGNFNESRLDECARELKKLAAYSQEVQKVPATLAKYGIRFVIVEPLSGGKVDGIATWLNDDSPVVGMSVRFDRIDAFWFTLGHELSHIKHRDVASVDSDVRGVETLDLDGKPEFECRADRDSAAMLISPKELDSFILRVGPLYSKERVNQFANKIKIHPGIIVGQLQHKNEIGYSANREMLVKIRHNVIQVALTDGWGHSVDTRGAT